MPARPCLDCGTPTRNGSRCVTCTRQRDRGRGTRTQRGYGTAHTQARQYLATTLPTPCPYCHRMVSEGERWVAAHVIDGDPNAGWVAAHPDCNERAKVRPSGGVPKSRTPNR